MAEAANSQAVGSPGAAASEVASSEGIAAETVSVPSASNTPITEIITSVITAAPTYDADGQAVTQSPSTILITSPAPAASTTAPSTSTSIPSASISVPTLSSSSQSTSNTDSGTGTGSLSSSAKVALGVVLPLTIVLMVLIRIAIRRNWKLISLFSGSDDTTTELHPAMNEGTSQNLLNPGGLGAGANNGQFELDDKRHIPDDVGPPAYSRGLEEQPMMFPREMPTRRVSL